MPHLGAIPAKQQTNQTHQRPERCSGLPAQLDLPQAYSKRWRLTVNVKKTKVVVHHAERQGNGTAALLHVCPHRNASHVQVFGG